MPRKQGPKKKDAPPPADRDAPAEADVDAHPFKPGSWLVVAWPPDGSERLATVIDRARVESDDRDAPELHHVRKDDLQRRDAARWRYYVHYADFNRRMDEWVRPARVVLPPSRAGPLAEAAGHGRRPHVRGSADELGSAAPRAPRGDSWGRRAGLPLLSTRRAHEEPHRSRLFFSSFTQTVDRVRLGPSVRLEWRSDDAGLQTPCARHSSFGLVAPAGAVPVARRGPVADLAHPFLRRPENPNPQLVRAKLAAFSSAESGI